MSKATEPSTTPSASDNDDGAHACAWNGCEAMFVGIEPPEGWSWLMLAHWEGDRCLCPKHVDALNRQLKD